MFLTFKNGHFTFLTHRSLLLQKSLTFRYQVDKKFSEKHIDFFQEYIFFQIHGISRDKKLAESQFKFQREASFELFKCSFMTVSKKNLSD